MRLLAPRRLTERVRHENCDVAPKRTLQLLLAPVQVCVLEVEVRVELLQAPEHLRIPQNMHPTPTDTWQLKVRNTGHQVLFGRTRQIQLALRPYIQWLPQQPTPEGASSGA